MSRRILAGGVAMSVATALLVPWGTAAQAADDPAKQLKPATASPSQSLSKGTVLDLGTGSKPETYIVQLEAPAVPTRATAAERGVNKAETSAKAYRADLVGQQEDLTKAIGRITSSTPKVLYRYTEAINGIAVKLTREQAQRVARIDGVSAVQVDFTRKLMTDKGPEWIGAPGIWSGDDVPSGVGNKGEGVVVGILDTGLNPANPSFADVVPTEDGGDGYDHTNPLGAGNYKGVCATDPTWGCNDKLIGYWNFSGSEKYDDDGHGSHTGSTTAGNQVDATAYSAQGTEHEFSVTSTIKGVAPHANVIGYDVCDGAGCQGSSIVAAIDQAIADQVDVINYSIGADAPTDAWNSADAVGFLNARAAGINVAISAGNAGPGAATLGSPAGSPWVTSVGATTHDRKYVASVTDLSSDAGAGPADIAGAGLSGATDQAYPVVYAGDAPYNNPQCGLPPDSEPAGTFPDGTDFTGKIVVCDRGGNGRVEKGENLVELGAEGMILANDQASGSSLNGDAHALPTAHITYSDSVALKAWMSSVTGEKVALSGSVKDVADANGDIMAAFSSRGENRAISIVGPSVSAPGVDILAAAGTDNAVEWHFISGTSMASPHTAGALALLVSAQPDWSPAERQSALMTTSKRDITDSDGTAADWFDMGSGRIDLTRAAKAGVVLDETVSDYEAANPDAGGDARTLNLASMADNECLQSCEWTRTFTGTSTGVGSWDVSVENLSDDLTLSVDKSTVEVTDGGNVDITVTAEIAAGADVDTWLNGALVLTPPAGSDAPVAHLPVAVLPSSGVLPKSIDITTRRDAGSQVTKGLESIAIDDLQVDASGLVPEKSEEISVVEDSTNSNPYDGNGVSVTVVDVPEGASSLIAKLKDPTAPDFDLYVGTGDTPSLATEVASSASGGSNEGVAVAEPAAGKWWILVQNWEATTAGGSDTADLLTAVVAGNEGNLRAEGPGGAIPAATPFDLRTFWDEPAMESGDTWHGALSLGTGPDSKGNVGVIPVTINRIEDDVTKTADKTEAAPGDVVTYTVDVAPNVTPEDLTYTITDTLPAGATYVEGSATNGASFDDGVVSWTGDLASTYGDEGNYTITTSDADPSCQTPLGGGYLDLKAEIGADPQSGAVGDTTALTAFSGGNFGFYGKSYKGLAFADDGFLLYGEENYGDPGDEPWTPQSLPDTAKPNSIAALMWQDMELRYDLATGAGVTLASNAGADGIFDPGDVGIIEFDNMRGYGDDAGAAGSLDMQVFATAGSNDLVFAYDNVTAGPLLQGVTVGTENATASQAATLVNAGDARTVIKDDLVVCAAYTEPEAPTASFSYQVKVDDTVGEKDLVNKVVHTTNDPGAKPVTASHTVAVKGSAPQPGTSAVALSLNPASIETGGTTTASATVVTSGAAATGDVQFFVGDKVVGTSTLNAAGQATSTLSGFSTAGTFPVTAKYLGNDTTAASTSAPVNLVVSTPSTPPVKVASKITAIAPKVIKKGKRAKVEIIVTAPKVTPSGTVTVKVRGVVKKTYEVVLDANGMGKIKLAKAKLKGKQKKGKIKVSLDYSGDAAVLPSSKKITITVKK